MKTEEDPPNLVTLRIYKSLTNQYFPVIISNNGHTDKTLENFSVLHILDTYKINKIHLENIYDLCDNSYGKRGWVVKKGIAKILRNGKSLNNNSFN